MNMIRIDFSAINFHFFGKIALTVVVALRWRQGRHADRTRERNERSSTVVIVDWFVDHLVCSLIERQTDFSASAAHVFFSSIDELSQWLQQHTKKC